jgi:SPOR domain
MDEYRWPRPGPGMVAVFALIGLIGGIAAGLLAPAGAQRGPQQDGGDQVAVTESTAPALPDGFYTVILASISSEQDRSVADQRAAAYRDAGVAGVGVLDSSSYTSLTKDYWVVYSGVFPSEQEALDHRDEIRQAHPDLGNCYVKQVTRS